MAQRHHDITAAGARVVGISVDPPPQNAAMVEKLQLPFPLLSDPDGSGAIKPYDVWHDDASIARPAIVLVRPDGEVAFRHVGGDFADRPTEDDVLAEVRALDLPAIEQPAPRPGRAEPGERAVDLGWLPAYLRGAKFAATAVGMRVPEAAEQVETLKAEYDRYQAALKALQERSAG